MSQRKPKFAAFQPTNIGAEPALVPMAQPKPVQSTPPEQAPESNASRQPERGPSIIEPQARSARRMSRMRELSDKIMPFSTRLSPEQADSFEALIRRTGKTKVHLVEEAFELLFRKYAKQ
jgi:hypothetical protein